MSARADAEGIAVLRRPRQGSSTAPGLLLEYRGKIAPAVDDAQDGDTVTVTSRHVVDDPGSNREGALTGLEVFRWTPHAGHESEIVHRLPNALGNGGGSRR